MIKKILSLTFLLLLYIGSSAYAQQLKIGYMDTQAVLSELPQRDKVEKQLNGFIETKRAALETKIADFQEKVAQYQSNSDNLTDQQAKQQEDELAETEAELREFQEQIQSEIQQKRESLLQPLYDSMDKAIAHMAEENGLDFVLNEATNNGENIIYYSADQQIDITQKVIQRIKQTSAKN